MGRFARSLESRGHYQHSNSAGAGQPRDPHIIDIASAT